MTAGCERRRLFSLPKLGQHLQGSLRGPLIAALSGVMLAVLLVTGVLICLFTAQYEQEMWITRQAEVADIAAATVRDWFADHQRQLSLVARLDAAALRANPHLLDIERSTVGDWLTILRLDAAGEPVASTGNTDQIATLLAQTSPAWRQSATGQKFSLVPYQTNPGSRPDLLLSVPTQDGGLVTGLLSQLSVDTRLSAIRLGQTGVISIVDTNTNAIIFQSDRSLSVQKGAVLSHTTPIPGLDWVVTTTLQMHESQLILRTAVAGFAAGLLALWGLTILFSTRFLRRLVFIPVDHLRQGAETFSSGKLDHRITVLRDDEIGAVTGEFNLMAARLAEHEHRLGFARDQVLQANRLRSEILANVSHELRTPLGIILGLAEMLDKGNYGPLPTEQCQPVTEIIQATGQLNRTINNLIDQSQLDSHLVKLTHTSFNPVELVNEIVRSVRFQAEKKRLAFEVSFARDLPSVLCGDPFRLSQIMVNLLDNAIKFTQTGKVGLRVYRPGPDHWAFQAIDTGCGIPSEAHHLIFEPFRQLDGSATREQNGAGLGLSIVTQLVDLMNGSILLESKVGKGSTFTVLLPIIPCNSAKDP